MKKPTAKAKAAPKKAVKTAAKKAARKAAVKKAPKASKIDKAVEALSESFAAKTAEIEAKAAKKPRKGKGKAEAAPPADVAPSLGAIYRKSLSAINKKMHIVAGEQKMLDPLPTGVLSLDYVMGGGAYTVFSSIAGEEQSGKSTIIMTMLGQAIHQGIPLIDVNDAETSMDPAFARNMMSNLRLENIFREGGPASYISETTLETYCMRMRRALVAMPFKTFSKDAGTWCYGLRKGAATTKQMLSDMADVGLKPDRKLSGAESSMWLIPTTNSAPEAAFFLDSWPSLLPEKIVEDDEAGGGMAFQARLLGQYIPMFAGEIKKRGAVFYSVNQLRNTMDKYKPWSEPGGNALKFFSVYRARTFSRAVPQGYEKHKMSSGLNAEPSASGKGLDLYAWKSYENTKSKVGTPFMKTMLRIWVSDYKGKPRGIDPVFDCYNYLKMTGQLSGPLKKLVIKLRTVAVEKPNSGLAKLASEPIDYKDFKALIVAEHFSDKEALRAIMAKLGLPKPPQLRAWLQKQIKSDKDLWATSTAATETEEEDDNDVDE